MSDRLNRPAVLLSILALALAACGSGNPSPSPSSAGPSGSGLAPSGSAVSPEPSGVGSPSPSASAAATVEGFWRAAARALSKSGRLRLVISGNGTRELRFEPKASAVVADNAVTSVCISGAAYTIQDLRSAVVPGKWACGASALGSAFRKSGQPAYAWNTRLPADTKIKERLTTPTKGRLLWDYTARPAILGGTVHTQLVQDVVTGRLIGGSRIDPTGSTHYTFSYTTIFAPIALP